MSRRNSHDAKRRRRVERAVVARHSEFAELFPAYLESDEAYLHHLLTVPEEELTAQQRQLLREIREHHPELRPPAEP